MHHTTLRQRIQRFADRPQYMGLPMGVRKLRISVEGTSTGTEVIRVGFLERDVQNGGGYLISAATPVEVPNITIDEGPLFFSCDAAHTGLVLVVEVWFDGTYDNGDLRRATFYVDPDNSPTSTDLSAAWSYAPHARSWLDEEMLAYQGSPVLGLVGNDTSVYTNAASNTSLLRIGSLVSRGNGVPTSGTVEQIRVRLNAEPKRVESAQTMDNTVRLSSLRLIKSGSEQAYDYVSTATHYNPQWPLDLGKRWYEYYPSDQPLWNTTWTPAQINSGFGFLFACQLVEVTEESGCVYAAIWEAEVDVYYTL